MKRSMEYNLTYTHINGTVDVKNSGLQLTVVRTEYIAICSCLFLGIGVTGIIGNIMVICVILLDSKMRKSMTNILITNLAMSDTLIMMLGIPEIVQFMLNKGWLIGDVLCKVSRTLLVCSLYVSVTSLVALCIERYIAIVFPIKAHILCTRRRTLVVVILVWILAIICALPTMIYNQVASPFGHGSGIQFCMIIFPGHHRTKFMIFKYVESALFYFIPMIIQISCYIIIGKKLFIGVDKLHTPTVRKENGTDTSKVSEAIKARKGVVKMLIASVTIYFLSYSPHQILLVYNTVSPLPFNETWVYLVCVTTLAYINSAVNPILYCIFSENFRRHFVCILTCKTYRDEYLRVRANTGTLHSNTEYTVLYRKPSAQKKLYHATNV